MEQPSVYGRMMSIHGRSGVSLSAPGLIYKFEPKGYVKLGHDITFDHQSFLTLPSDFSSPIAHPSELDDVFILEFSPESFAVAAQEYGLDAEDLDAVFQGPRVYRETVWISELMHRLRFEMALHERNENLCIRFVMAELLKELYYQFFGSRQLFPIHEPGSTDYVVQKALRLLYRSENFDIDLRTLAASLNISPSTLTRRFSCAMGQKPGEFLRIRRMERAHTLLLTSGLSVAAIAKMVGYEETAPFSAAFKKHFHCTPRELRTDRNLQKIERSDLRDGGHAADDQGETLAWAEPV